MSISTIYIFSCVMVWFSSIFFHLILDGRVEGEERDGRMEVWIDGSVESGGCLNRHKRQFKD